MGVVASIANERESLLIAGQIAGWTLVTTDQEFVRIVDIVQIGLSHRPRPVDTLKVEASLSKILESADIFRLPQWGPIMGDVMCNKLPEEGPARRYPWIVVSKCFMDFQAGLEGGPSALPYFNSASPVAF